MDSETASLLVTDPPYGVAYGSGAKGRWRIENDDLGEMQSEFWTAALGHWPLSGDAYVFSPSGPLISTMCRAIEKAGIAHHQWLIWVKDRLVIGRSHYHYRHEHIFYGWKGRSSWNGSRKEDSVWQVNRPGDSPAHPTMKPVALFERAVENSSREGDLVIDPFTGSGTALIAAERMGRRCFGVEVDPYFRSVALASWEAFTGHNAEKLGG